LGPALLWVETVTKSYFGWDISMYNMPDKFLKELMVQPETGMGYQIANIVLNDGRLYKQALIIEGKLVEIRGMKNIPFIGDEIQQVILTHEKWDFSKD
jgi:hypothetical protein